MESISAVVPPREHVRAPLSLRLTIERVAAHVGARTVAVVGRAPSAFDGAVEVVTAPAPDEATIAAAR
ncbi:MAG TPA: hypothetical protein VLK58_27485, partial [Conexibacter sp.]|nr:hypothetical protein [Conexibacter sp.]